MATVTGRPNSLNQLSSATGCAASSPDAQTPGHHAFTQLFEAMHLRLHQTASVVSVPLLPDAPPQLLACTQRFVCVKPLLPCVYFHARAFLRGGMMA